MRLARVGDAYLLERAVNAAADLDRLVDPLIASGAALRAEKADQSSQTLRSWVARPATFSNLDNWWVRAEIVKPKNGADLTWSLEAAPTRDGAWRTVATGEHDPDGTGTLALDMAYMAEVIGEDSAVGTLSVSYDDHTGPQGLPVAEYEVGDTLTNSSYWLVESTFGLVWSGSFSLSEDGESWPGTAKVWHFEEKGGRALGYLFKEPDVPLLFESCWSDQGDSVWTAGDADIIASGDPDGCTAPELD